jgi:phage baseplate assembly protein W
MFQKIDSFKSNKKDDYYSDLTTNLIAHPNTKDLFTVKNNEAVKRSIKNLVLTDIYERPFSKIGGDVNSSLFENITPQSAESLRKKIEFTIGNYEPRAKVKEIIVSAAADSNAYNIDIYFYTINIPEIEKLQLTLTRVR